MSATTEKLAERINADRMKSVLMLVGFLFVAPRLFGAAAGYAMSPVKWCGSQATNTTAPLVAGLMLAEGKTKLTTDKSTSKWRECLAQHRLNQSR